MTSAKWERSLKWVGKLSWRNAKNYRGKKKRKKIQTQVDSIIDLLLSVGAWHDDTLFVWRFRREFGMSHHRTQAITRWLSDVCVLLVILLFSPFNNIDTIDPLTYTKTSNTNRILTERWNTQKNRRENNSKTKKWSYGDESSSSRSSKKKRNTFVRSFAWVAATTSRFNMRLFAISFSHSITDSILHCNRTTARRIVYSVCLMPFSVPLPLPLLSVYFCAVFFRLSL